MDGPWSAAVEYLQATAAEEPYEGRREFELKAGRETAGHIDDLAAVVSSGGKTTLGELRQQQLMNQTNGQQQQSAAAGTEIEQGVEPEADQDAWAGAQIRAFVAGGTDTELAAVWRLPTTQLQRVCARHLAPAELSAAQVAGLIGSVATDAAATLENQCVVLGEAGRRLAGAAAVAAVVQSQVVGLLDRHARVVVAGLVLPLFDRGLGAGAAALAAKCVRAGLPEPQLLAVVERAAERADLINEHVLQVLEAVAAAQPRGSSRRSRWVDVLVLAAARLPASRRLGALLLHYVNKFGGQLDGAELGRLGASAQALTTPLKGAVRAAIDRRLKSQRLIAD
ncbi:hypothetical protein IWW55_004601 [Coemansia sp. RSA 2706]|nr:hypothetical protein IWW55_004601 [Coemansia sp. RSA 2706]KAJ2307145.1 hypothetical protein IWW54_004487 [Coemansia sp. RSA 2705]KAJ2317754.1 hypothetical protein IWW52_002951 [Coemansia sp. RSA 2704]KAJ2322708.1 hypothetical protein IWW51_004108 [Coemansia sp. RSA 2702]KAJ2732605.1 hypothetical protein H4R23_002808 [Coemansia sp. Cherry 401B]